MKTIDLYHAYKEKLPNCIVIIKEGIFYKTFEEDAKLLWYLFDYKYANGIISFGNLSYDKVIDKCIQSEIGILIASREKEEFSFVGDIEVYSSYCLLANKAFDKQERKKKTILLLEKILDKYPQYNEEIEKFLTDLVEEITEKSME